ncbi:hypothetical protein V2G26_006437 [Clonostachys chloroleuca]
MSIFSTIRKTRKDAKDQNAKLAEQKKKEEETTPYRHVPTHAATDAFASAPPRWREAADRARIIEHNQRRSAMASGSSQVSLPSATVPRVGSSLSYVSFPGSPMSLRARMPKSYSYSGVSPYSDGNRDVIYSAPSNAYAKPAPFKEQWHAESTSDETSSQDELEMRKPQRESVPQSNGPKDSPHRLHPASRSRRTSDASLDRRAVSNSTSQKAHGKSTSSRDSRPPPSMRGFSHTTPTPSLVPTQSYSTPGPSPGNDMATSPTQPDATTVRNTKSFRHNSAPILPGLTLDSTRPMPTSNPSSPLALATTVRDDYLDSHTTMPNGNSSASNHEPNVPAIEPTKSQPNIQSTVMAPPSLPLHMVAPWEDDQNRGKHLDGKVEIVNTFPERAADFDSGDSPKHKTKRFSKSGGKLLKKHRR